MLYVEVRLIGYDAQDLMYIPNTIYSGKTIPCKGNETIRKQNLTQPHFFVSSCINCMYTGKIYKLS